VHELDSVLLRKFKIMDYSLLVGIHQVKEGKECGREVRGLFSEDGAEIYFLGIIDFSIKYSLKKQAETLINVVRGCDERASCVSQDCYAMRQVSFARERVFAAAEGEEDAGTLGTLGALGARGAGVAGGSGRRHGGPRLGLRVAALERSRRQGQGLEQQGDAGGAQKSGAEGQVRENRGGPRARPQGHRGARGRAEGGARGPLQAFA